MSSRMPLYLGYPEGSRKHLPFSPERPKGKGREKYFWKVWKLIWHEVSTRNQRKYGLMESRLVPWQQQVVPGFMSCPVCLPLSELSMFSVPQARLQCVLRCRGHRFEIRKRDVVTAWRAVKGTLEFAYVNNYSYSCLFFSINCLAFYVLLTAGQQKRFNLFWGTENVT